MVPYFATSQAPEPKSSGKIEDLGGGMWVPGANEAMRTEPPSDDQQNTRYDFLPGEGLGKRPMSRVRLSGFIVIFLALGGCARDTFDLLPPEADEPEAGAPAEGGSSSGGMSGFGGVSGFGATGPGTGGRARGGSTGGSSPIVPNCPVGLPDCRPCRVWEDCEIGELCDVWRSYCAPYCGGMNTFCGTPPVTICDRDRAICVECTIPSHCADRRLTCVRGECVEPECSLDSQCGDEICDENGVCRPCFSDFDCAPGMRCSMGRCELAQGPIPPDP